MKEVKDSKNIRIHLRSGIDLKLPRMIIAHMELPNVSILGHYLNRENKAMFKKELLSSAVCRFSFRDVPFKNVPFKKKDVAAV